jgi:two-component system sensor histidine kinase ChvG
MNRLRRWLSKISIRLLAFNVLLVFLPAAGILFLDTYEQHLLEAQERTMVQEGRLLAAALEAYGRLKPEDARRILIQLRQRHEARLRVVDQNRKLLADSASLGPRREASLGSQPSGSASRSRRTQESTLYRLGSAPFRFLRKVTAQVSPQTRDEYDGATHLDGPEIRNALEGRYGAISRVSSGDRPSLTLYSAIPIGPSNRPIGAVLVSQSTAGILRTLYAVRLDIFKVFLGSLAAAVVLTLLVSTTIARPLALLRRQAEAILDRKGRLRGSFNPSKRRDEIGDLERALAELTRRLETHIQAMESFASDLSHEFKNPLASIRTATEMALDVDEPEERRRFLAMIQRDVMRLERLLSGAREISRIDARLEEEEREIVCLDQLLPTLVDGFRLRLGQSGPQFVLAVANHDVLVSASGDRLTQVFENLLENAVSFSPPGGTVSITVRITDNRAMVAVADDGPGIPEEHRDRIFARFFSYRPPYGSRSEDHSGLGLAIVKAIVDGYSGTVVAQSRPKGGTDFVVTLPIAPD